MRELFVEKVINATEDFLDNNQRIKLKEILTKICLNYQIEMIEQTKKQETQKNNTDILNKFISSKEIEGCSNRTLNYYKDNITKMLDTINVSIDEITTETLRNYLADYKGNSKAGRVTIDNIRRILVGEITRLNISDMNFQERSCIVLGKGNSEIEVYFSAKSKMYIKEYLETRIDNNEALFVSLIKPYNRLGISGIEILIRNLGKKANINKVHPHKFRRTMATMVIDKGMPIEQVQKLVGHIKIDTTMEYAMMNQSNVKNSHRK